MKSLLRTTVIAGLTGTLAVGAAWAGVGLAPVSLPTTVPDPAGVVAGVTAGQTATTGESTGITTAQLAELGAGQLLVGAAKQSIYPQPDASKGEVWERDLNKCTRLETITKDLPEDENWRPKFENLIRESQNVGSHLASTGTPWPENPNCIYQGGYGLGPMFPVNEFDTELGLWVRTVAISDRTDTILLTVIDGEGWLWDYKSKCERCGTKQIQEDLIAKYGATYGLKPGSFNLHATHSHTSPDFLGGWGFVPDWYMTQVTETIHATAAQALASLEPAVLEVGAEEARKHNSDRRGTYYSAEESELTWLRAVAVQQQAPAAAATTTDTKGKKKPAPSPSPTASGEPTPARVIATLGAFAAHPVTQDQNKGVAHPDWPGFFAKQAEARFGGVGMHFMTGLGNVTGASGGKRDDHGHIVGGTGFDLANLIPAVGAGRPVDKTDLRVAQTTWQQPVTNAPLDALGTPGFFDRQFDAMPAKVSPAKESTDAHASGDPEKASRACVSAAPQSVELPVTVAKIGDDFALSTGPGELFSNLTNVIKEETVREEPSQPVTFPLAQINDSLGYMPQSFELHPVGQQGLGFAAGGYFFVNYEDSYAIDRCVGDMVLETTLAALKALPRGTF